MTTCLIVDDSKVVRMLARRIVESLGFTVKEADNGESALAACRAQAPDCILLDWHMPVMDGLEFIKQLRASESITQPKVIFCTTETDISHIQDALAAGADEYVMKPFDAEIIKEKMIQVGML